MSFEKRKKEQREYTPSIQYIPLRISKRLFISLEIKILVKNYPPTASSIRYINIDILYSGFLASPKWRARIAL